MRAQEHLRQGLDAFSRRAWAAAFEALQRADEAEPLPADDLEALATAAYMRARNDEYLAALQRAHRLHRDAGDLRRAARCAFWIGMHLARSGELGAGTGWLSRAQRLVDEAAGDGPERAYLLLPRAFQLQAQGELLPAAEIAGAAAAAGRSYGDDDLLALALHLQGNLLVGAGDVVTGVALLDEAMVALTSSELSPVVSGIVYCGVISGCHAAFEVRRAQEWTTALGRWCADQPDMIAFSGACLVHRAEIMQLRGAWPDALEEARRADERCREVRQDLAAAQARVLEADLLRLQGQFDAAEAAYRDAAREGAEPQPGLALLRLAQGDVSAGAVALRRALGETTDPVRRASLLPACVDVLLADGDTDGARRAAEELAELATGHPSSLLAAGVEHARGAVALAAGDPNGALPALRHAWRTWQDVGAPYQGARVRVLVAQACRALGDEDAAAMELDAAREVFAALGAAPDLRWSGRLLTGDGNARPGAAGPGAGGGSGNGGVAGSGLTGRELEVLRLVARGSTNRVIAAELVLSERTVDRHVSNILGKLRVSSRAAATAHAYEHHLL